MALHLVQIKNGNRRGVAKVQGSRLLLVPKSESVYELAQYAAQKSMTIASRINELGTSEELSYDQIYAGLSDWILLPPIDVPGTPSRCVVSGTGLTHVGSAKSRQAMHASPQEMLTDSMKMFQWGIEGGNPGDGRVGVAPEWFYKGNGATLRGHLDDLEVPFYAEDGGEEAEVASVYFIDNEGRPNRIGFAIGNEFSDHIFERKNYLNLAGSKLRHCAIGPELIVTDEFDYVQGRVFIDRDGQALFSSEIETGQRAMSHSLQNLEHHHFKFELHRVPGDIHVHFLGAATLSFSSGVTLKDGDWVEISFDGFGRPLRNRIRVASPEQERLIKVGSLA